MTQAKFQRLIQPEYNITFGLDKILHQFNNFVDRLESIKNEEASAIVNTAEQLIQSNIETAAESSIGIHNVKQANTMQRNAEDLLEEDSEINVVHRYLKIHHRGKPPLLVASTDLDVIEEISEEFSEIYSTYYNNIT